MTQMKRQHKVELDAIMNDNASLEATITDLNDRLITARNKEREQMKKMAALEREYVPFLLLDADRLWLLAKDDVSRPNRCILRSLF